MPNQLTGLRFPDEEPFNDFNCDGKNEIKPLSLINIFIGQNNSGKSRLLRNLFRDIQLDYNTIKLNYSTTHDHEILEKFENLFPYPVTQIGQINKSELLDIFDVDDCYLLGKDTPILEKLEQLFKDASNTDSSLKTEGPDYPGSGFTLQKEMNSFGREGLEWVKTLKKYQSTIDAKRIYIPILRGLRPLDPNKRDLYKDRTRHDYFVRINKNQETDVLSPVHTIFTGAELYDDLQSKRLGEPQDWDLVEEFEKFISNMFFDGKKVILMPKKEDQFISVKIGSEKLLPIYDLGDGLQNLIIITYNIFINKERCVFYIEEPDLAMHPSFQRILIEVMKTHNHHQYFLSTHSNHLLDIIEDINDVSVFHFKKTENNGEVAFDITPIKKRDNDLLADIGVRNSSVFLANSTIWVEGITDRLYIKAYMDKYLQELTVTDAKVAKKYGKYREDFHYSFVEYQGSNLVHWTFEDKDAAEDKINAYFLCGDPILIADGDFTDKGNRKEVYSEYLGEKLRITPGKEIENLIPFEILKEVVKEAFSSENKSLDDIKYDKYSKSKDGLGKYLDKILFPDDKGKKFATETGTVANKHNFCKNAVKLMNDDSISWVLPKPVLEICEAIFKHIKENNS